MATRLRSMATSIFTKIILFILLVGLVVTALLGGVQVVRTAEQNNLPLDSLGTFRYEDSGDFLQMQRDIASALYWRHDVTKLYGYDRTPTFYYRAEYADGSVVTNLSSTSPPPGGFWENYPHFVQMFVQPDGYWAMGAEKYRGRGNTWMPSSIARDRRQVFPLNGYSYTTNIDSNRRYQNPSYQIVDSNTLSADSSDTAPLSASSIAQETTEVEVEINTKVYFDDSNGWSASDPCPTFTVWVAFEETALNSYQQFWQQCRLYFTTQLVLLCGLALAAVLILLWLLIVCGRRPGDRELHLLFIDRMWTEGTLFLTTMTVVGAVVLCTIPFAWYDSFSQMDNYTLMLLVAGFTSFASLFVLGCMSLLRLLKAHRFIRNSLTFLLLAQCWKIIVWCWRPFGMVLDLLRSCFDHRAFPNASPAKGMVQRFAVFLITLYGLAALVLVTCLAAGEFITFIMLGIVGLLMLPLAYWHLKGLQTSCQKLLEQVQESHTQQVRSEGTKTALITNVSHDLKTPLTSIITYIDLLQKEELGDTARDYVTILAQKSDRLRSMVSDLFDLSKSSSGNLPITPEVLDMKRLLEQTLADMADSIDQSGLQLKTTFPMEPLYIYSDGKKLYRVFQNLIGNAVKYGMPGTRVFVTLQQSGSLAVAAVKNTAAYEMDFTPEEILQRFSRGDKSRAGEGSGLGLSIAESFSAACGGELSLQVDGDFFKVTVSFPLTDRKPEPEAEAETPAQELKPYTPPTTEVEV